LALILSLLFYEHFIHANVLQDSESVETFYSGPWMSIRSCRSKSSGVTVHECPEYSKLELTRISIVNGTAMREFVNSLLASELKERNVVPLARKDAARLLQLFNKHFEEKAAALLESSLAHYGRLQAPADDAGSHSGMGVAIAL
jgi:hypothetical protein